MLIYITAIRKQKRISRVKFQIPKHMLINSFAFMSTFLLFARVESEFHRVVGFVQFLYNFFLILRHLDVRTKNNIRDTRSTRMADNSTNFSANESDNLNE